MKDLDEICLSELMTVKGAGPGSGDLENSPGSSDTTTPPDGSTWCGLGCGLGGT